MAPKINSLTEALTALRTEHKRIVAQLHRDHQSVRSIASSAWRAQEAERRRLARELHDGVGQTLGALKNELSLLVSHDLDDAARQRAERALELCAGSIADIRELSRLLFPPALTDLGLEAALEQLVRIVNGQQQLTVELITEGDLHVLPLDSATFVYRVCQEALTNASRYAPGSSVLIRMRIRDQQCSLLIMDDGPGFDAGKAGADGFGLQAMKERAALFGATLAIDSAPGEGTRIRARIALERESDEKSAT